MMTVRLLLTCLALTWFASGRSAAFGAEIVTIGGNGTDKFTGDGGPALEAGIGEPFGLTLGPDGALYVCSVSSHCVRRIDLRTNVITTVAGSGRRGYAGDGGPATAALCNEPYEVRFDAEGNMFFVEMQNHLIRRVDRATGEISTIAGTGQAGYSGDGGPATKAEFKSPHSIALDGAGGLYVADIGNHRVRRIDLKSGIVETFAGDGKNRSTPDGAPVAGTSVNGPRALDFDSQGQMFLALREGNAVYRVDLAERRYRHLGGTGEKGNVGDGGAAQRARLNGPKGIALGPQGDIYLADTENHTIRVIRKKDGTIDTVAGDGQMGNGPDGDPLKCRLSRPHGVFVDPQGTVFIGDSSNHRVRMLSR
ncbi:MAG: hypothetical protein JSS02_25715 [Planctomycetes bacterium]|nr:hypothetical protein [Planctomycetota bacterium]